VPKDLYTEYAVLPGHEQDVERILQELALFVRSDPSALQFLPYALEPGRRKYLVLERFLNEQSCHAHLVSPERRDLIDRLCRHTTANSAVLTWLQAVT